MLCPWVLLTLVCGVFCDNLRQVMQLEEYYEYMDVDYESEEAIAKHRASDQPLLEPMRACTNQLRTSSGNSYTIDHLHDCYVTYASVPPVVLQRNYKDDRAMRDNLSAAMAKVADANPLGVEKVSDNLALIVKTVPQVGEETGRKYFGRHVFRRDNFVLREVCLVSESMSIAFVVYAPNTTPHVNYKPPSNVVIVQAIEMIRIQRSTLPVVTSECADSGFAMIVMELRTPAAVFNANSECRHWIESKRGWFVGDCEVYYYSTSTATCRCDARTMKLNSANYFIFVSYFEPNVLTMFDDTEPVRDVQSEPSTELEHYRSQISEVAASTSITVDKLNEGLVKTLQRVFLLDAALYTDASLTEAMMDDVGRILYKFFDTKLNVIVNTNVSDVETAANVLFVSVGSLEMSLSYVNSPYNTYKTDRFAFYKNHPPWIRYTNHDNHDNYNYDENLKHHHYDVLEYAFYFSYTWEDALRYAFMVYPVDKFFKSPPSVCGALIASRVLDLVVKGNRNWLTTTDKTVRIFFNPKKDSSMSQLVCALWSFEANVWNSSSCLVDEGLLEHECACEMATPVTFKKKATYRFVVIAVEYKFDADIYMADWAEKKYDMIDVEEILVSKFMLRRLPIESKRIPKGNFLQGIASFATILKSIPFGFLSLDDVDDIIAGTRMLVLGNPPKSFQIGTGTSDFGVAVFNSSTLPRDQKTFNIVTYRNGVSSLSSEVTNKSMFVLDELTNLQINVSDLVGKNDTIAITVYPKDMSPFRFPALPIGQTVITCRVLNIATRNTPPTLKIYFDQSAYGSQLECATWGDWRWTNQGCSIVEEFGHKICLCMVPKPLYVDNHGMLLIVYGYVESMFKKVIFWAVKSDGVHLISNLTGEIGLELRQLMARTLSITLQTLPKKSSIGFGRLPDVFNGTINSYFNNKDVAVFNCYGISTPITLKRTDLFTDFASADDHAGEKITSWMFFIVCGFYREARHGPIGFYLTNNRDPIQAMYYNENFETSETNLELACYFSEPIGNLTTGLVRFRITVFPINTPDFAEIVTTTAPVFNTRTIDIHTLPEESGLNSTDSSNAEDNAIVANFLFKPTLISHIVTGCAIFGDEGFISCSAPLSSVACGCRINSRQVTRVVLYEYLDLENITPNFNYVFPNLVILFLAVASCVCITLTLLTAMVCQPWRGRVVNKTVINLSVSALFYNIVLLYRMSHAIYAVPGHSNVAVIAFNALVHYTRLGVLDGMVLASVTQWKRDVLTALLGKKLSLYFAISFILAWLLPFVPLGTLLCWNQNRHFLVSNILTSWLLLLLPGCLVVVVNVVLIAATLYDMRLFWNDREEKMKVFEAESRTKKGKRKKLSAKKKEEFRLLCCLKMNSILDRFKSLVHLLFLTGLFVTFELIGTSGGFNGALSSVLMLPLGCALFAYFVCLDKDARRFWAAKVSSWRDSLVSSVTDSKIDRDIEMTEL